MDSLFSVHLEVYYICKEFVHLITISYFLALNKKVGIYNDIRIINASEVLA